MKRLLMALVLAFTAPGFSQSEASNIIVRLEKNNFSLQNLNFFGFKATELLVEDLNMVLFEPTFRVLDSTKVLEMVRTQPGVLWAQLDHTVAMREVIPNNSSFNLQWSLKSTPDADISATYAWLYSKGGKTTDGQSIVMAVVDQGVEVTHPNLVENIWVNSAEVPNNGIDDDGNGYVDDVNGWDAVLQKGGAIPAGYHGTHVAGIMGAKGNTGLPVTGVNWDAQIMTVRALGSGGGNITSVVLRAYGYILQQKKLWLETQGEKGANIVVTNSSFGVDGAKCDSGEYPVWTEIYNAMGEVGILSAAATVNANWDIDETGDVPTSCASPYIIAVTNTQKNGTKNSQAGYGAQTIHIGAPGTDIQSTMTNGKIGSLTGTSMATPHVAGAVGFLHSLAPSAFVSLRENNPAEAALLIKEIILASGTPQADLAGKTTTGKRLNLKNAAEAMLIAF